MALATVISQIIEKAHKDGLSQKGLAKRVGISEESLSRMKKRGSARLGLVTQLADAVGLRVTVVPKNTQPPRQPPAERQPFRDRYRALVWSNPDTDDSIYLRRALLQPTFQMLLDGAVEFGLPRLEQEWQLLDAEGSPEAQRAAARVQRMLKHLHDGYEQATA